MDFQEQPPCRELGAEAAARGTGGTGPGWDPGSPGDP